MRSIVRWTLCCSFVALSSIVPRLVPPALGDPLDPGVARTVIVGEPRGHAPSERIDGHRTGLSRLRLPSAPVERWRRRVGGAVDLPPVVDAEGRIYVALTSPELVALSQDGRELWRVRTGAAAAVTPPLLTSSGTIVLVTATGHAIGISPAGRVRFTTALGLRGRDIDAVPLALEDGGVVLGGRALIVLDAGGSVRARAPMEDRALGALLAGPDGVLVTAESGGVYTFRPPAMPRRIGSLGGAAKRGAVLADGRTLLAVVDGRSLVALDLPTATTQVRLSISPAVGSLDAPPALHPDGLAVISTYAGMLVGVDAAGNEKIRVTLEKLTGTAPPGGASGATFFGSSDLRASPAVIVDRDGHTAFARAGGRVGVVRPDGTVAVAGERMCANAIALQPAGEERMVLACRDGTIWMIGQ